MLARIILIAIALAALADRGDTTPAPCRSVMMTNAGPFCLHATEGWR